MGDEIEIVGIRDTTKTTCTGVEMFRKLLDRGEAGGQYRRAAAPVSTARGWSGWPGCSGKPGSVTPHTKFEAEAYILTKGRGWPPHAVLRELPAAVLLPHDGRDRHGGAARRHRDGDAGRQPEVHGRADRADFAMEDGPALRDPRRRAGPSAPAWLSKIIE